MNHTRVADLVLLLMCIAVARVDPSWAEANESDSVSKAPISFIVTYASRYSFQGLDYSEGQPVLLTCSPTLAQS